MSFLSALFTLLFGKSEPEKTYKTYDTTPSRAPVQEPKRQPRSCEIPTIDSSRYVNEVKNLYPIVIRDTLALCSGIPGTIREEIEDRLCATSPIDIFPLKAFAQEVASRLESIDWHWHEYEYWRTYYLEHGIKTVKMFDPRPEKLSFPAERKQYQPEKVFNLMTLKEAKERLITFPETASMKRAELIDFLKSNKSAWQSVIDPHIQAKWNAKKHYEGETPEKILFLLFQTILDRARALNEFKPEENPTPFFIADADEKLYWVAKADPQCPWKQKYGHPVPGGHVDYRPTKML